MSLDTLRLLLHARRPRAATRGRAASATGLDLAQRLLERGLVCNLAVT